MDKPHRVIEKSEQREKVLTVSWPTLHTLCSAGRATNPNLKIYCSSVDSEDPRLATQLLPSFVLRCLSIYRLPVTPRSKVLPIVDFNTVKCWKHELLALQIWFSVVLVCFWDVRGSSRSLTQFTLSNLMTTFVSSSSATHGFLWHSFLFCNCIYDTLCQKRLLGETAPCVVGNNASHRGQTWVQGLDDPIL